MADGEITLKLDPRTLERLSEQASLSGQTVEAIAAGLLDAATTDFDHEIAVRRLADFDQNGGATMTVQEAAERFDHEAAKERDRWAETYRRLDEFDKNGGVTMTVDEAFDELRRRIAEKRARL